MKRDGTSTPLLCDILVADDGDVTWAVDEAADVSGVTKRAFAMCYSNIVKAA